MEQNIGLIILAVGHLSITLLLLFLVLTAGRRRGLSYRNRLTKVKNRNEQQLLQEAISICEDLHELPVVLKALGDHAAEATGFSQWMIWLADPDGSCHLADYRLANRIDDRQALLSSNDARLYSWVRNNAQVLQLTSFVPELAGSPAMREALDRLHNGILIPLTHLGGIQGFLLVGGGQNGHEKRSTQFFELYGSFAAMTIRNTQLHERDQHQQQLQHHAEKLAAIGKLAAGMAHEIRNPLTFIKASTQHLIRRYDFSQEDGRLCDEMIEEIGRINKHVEDLLVLGRIDPGEFRLLDLAAMIRNVVVLVDMRARSLGIELDTEDIPNQRFIYGNEELLRQLVLNLVLNGLEAMGKGGRLTIRIINSEHLVRIIVSDTGGGIDPAIAGRIFDPFFTTKEKGTGLGLSVSYSIAQAHGGVLELDSTGNDGTRFSITLPASDPRTR